MEPEPGSLHDRLRVVAGQRSYRALADLTQHNTETVRRYMLGAAPSIEFVAAMCSRFGINADWMLTGRGAMHDKENRRHALNTSSPADLLAAVAGALERLTDRVDRIETYVQTMETRLRAAAADSMHDATPDDHQQPDNPPAPPGKPKQGGLPQPYAPKGDNDPIVRSVWIAGAVPKRPRPDAD